MESYTPIGGYKTKDFVDLRLAMKSKGLKPKTINKTMALLRRQFNQAVEHEIIAKNPLNSKSLKPFKVEEFVRKAFPFEDVRQICDQADKPYDKILMLAFYTGIRVGELYRIQIQDIKNEMLYITKSKTKKVRQVPLANSEVLSIVRELSGSRKSGPLIHTHSNYASFRAFLSCALKIAYYRFTHEGQDPPRRDRKWLQENIPNITTQDLRHSCTSYLRKQGMDSEMRAKILGNSKAVNEGIYPHYQDSTLLREMEKCFSDQEADTTIAPAESTTNGSVVLPLLKEADLETLKTARDEIERMMKTMSAEMQKTVTGQ